MYDSIKFCYWTTLLVFIASSSLKPMEDTITEKVSYGCIHISSIDMLNFPENTLFFVVCEGNIKNLEAHLSQVKRNINVTIKSYPFEGWTALRLAVNLLEKNVTYNGFNAPEKADYKTIIQILIDNGARVEQDLCAKLIRNGINISKH